MLSVSLNESTSKDNDDKIREKLITKLSSNCKYHSGSKELLICVTCGMAICDQCSSKHEGHQKLYKTELINSGKELKQIVGNCTDICQLPTIIRKPAVITLSP